MLQNKDMKRTAKDIQYGIFVNNFMDCKTTNRQVKQNWVKYINTLKPYIFMYILQILCKKRVCEVIGEGHSYLLQ